MDPFQKEEGKKSYRAKWHTRESFYEIKVVDSSLNRPAGKIVEFIFRMY